MCLENIWRRTGPLLCLKFLGSRNHLLWGKTGLLHVIPRGKEERGFLEINRPREEAACFVKSLQKEKITVSWS